MSPPSNAVGLVGPDGRIAAFSRLAFPTPPISLADREYLRSARAGMVGTFISEVIEARPTGTRVFVLSRACSGPDGKPNGGVVTSALSPSYFADFYASIIEGPHDAITLAREDGAILARYPPMPEQAPWQAHPDNPLISMVREASTGRSFLQTSKGFDRGEARLVTFRRLKIPCACCLWPERIRAAGRLAQAVASSRPWCRCSSGIAALADRAGPGDRTA